MGSKILLDFMIFLVIFYKKGGRMRNMKSLLSVSLLFFLFQGCASSEVKKPAVVKPTTPTYRHLKKRIAVIDLKPGRYYGGISGIEHRITDMLVTALVNSGNFTVVERNELKALMQEQALGQTGAITAQSAASIGSLLGVQAIVIGSVTEGGLKSSHGSLNLGNVGIKRNKISAEIAIDVRVINTSTGEIICAAASRKEKSKTGLSLRISDFSKTSNIDFDRTLLGKAARDAVDEVAAKISRAMSNIPWQGKIIKVSGNVVYMKPGSDAGIRVGSHFFVYHKGEALIDPDTGLPLGSEETKCAEIQVVSFVGNKVAKANVLSGGNIDTGDIVKTK